MICVVRCVLYDVCVSCGLSCVRRSFGVVVCRMLCRVTYMLVMLYRRLFCVRVMVLVFVTRYASCYVRGVMRT